MGFYNVVNRALMQSGQAEDISQVVANLDAIAAVLNGGIDNTNVNAAAAIARSKLDFGAGLVNADIAAAAAIADTKVAGIVVVGAVINASAANTDVAWDGGSAASEYRSITTGAGSIRSIGAATRGAGTRLILRNGSAAAVTLKHNLAGGTGVSLFLRSLADTVMAVNDVYEFMYSVADGLWIEIDRDVPIAATIGTEITYTEFTAGVTVVATSEATATTIVTNGAFTADGVSAYLVEFFTPFAITPSSGGTNLEAVLYVDGASVGKMGKSTLAVNELVPWKLERRVIFAAGTRTLSVRAFAGTASVSSINAGVGGSGAYMPGFLRCTKVT